jgi:hypothetical protein
VRDYHEHRENIKNLVLQHMLRTQSVHEFELTNCDGLSTKMNNAVEFRNFLSKHRASILRGDPILSELGATYHDIMGSYLGKTVERPPNEDDFKLCFDCLSMIAMDCQRLLQGDQITIYIPKKYKKNEILDLCVDIDGYTKSNGLVMGEMTAVESRIGMSCIGFRQEYLTQDLNDANHLGRADISKRIDSLVFRMSRTDHERRTLVKSQRENSPLYRYLDRTLA